MTSTTKAFETSLLAEVEAVRRIGRRRLRRREDLDDFVQEVLLRAWAHRETLRDRTRLPEWVGAIARNTAQKWNKRKTPIPAEMLWDVPDDRAGHASSERWETLLEALASLSPSDRELFHARYVEDASYEELQERYGLTYTAVGGRLTRIRERLRRRVNALLSLVGGAFVATKRVRAYGGIVFMAINGKITGSIVGGVLLMVLAGGIYVRTLQKSSDVPESSSSATPAGVADSTRSSTRPDVAFNNKADDKKPVPHVETVKVAEPQEAANDTNAAERSSLPLEDDSSFPEQNLPPTPTKKPLTSEQQAVFDRLTVILQPQADFDAWFRQHPQPPAEKLGTAEWLAWVEAAEPWSKRSMETNNALRREFPQVVTVTPLPNGHEKWSIDYARLREMAGGRLPLMDVVIE